jgi:hypothetical protein
VRAQLNADAAQHEEPQHHGQRQVKAAEAGCVEKRKCEVQRPTCGEQPNLVAVPNGTDGTQDGTALLVVPGDEEVDCARPEVKAVQQNVNRDHHCHDHEP